MLFPPSYISFPSDNCVAFDNLQTCEGMGKASSMSILQAPAGQPGLHAAGRMLTKYLLQQRLREA